MRRALYASVILAGKGCALCGARFRSINDMIRDHVIPLAEGGADNATNEQAICLKCSDRKTHAESQRGRRKW